MSMSIMSVCHWRNNCFNSITFLLTSPPKKTHDYLYPPAAMKSGGTQLKLIMTFQNYGQALFKPMK